LQADVQIVSSRIIEGPVGEERALIRKDWCRCERVGTGELREGHGEAGENIGCEFESVLKVYMESMNK